MRTTRERMIASERLHVHAVARHISGVFRTTPPRHTAYEDVTLTVAARIFAANCKSKMSAVPDSAGLFTDPCCLLLPTQARSFARIRAHLR
jgi:hypothetical protein